MPSNQTKGSRVELSSFNINFIILPVVVHETSLSAIKITNNVRHADFIGVIIPIEYHVLIR